MYKIRNTLFNLCAFSLIVFLPLFAQSEKAIPKDFFMGKWGGIIYGEIIDDEAIYPFSVELVGRSPGSLVSPVNAFASAWIKIDGTWPNRFTLIDTSAACLVSFGHDYSIFAITFHVSDPATITEMGHSSIFNLAGFTFQI